MVKNPRANARDYARYGCDPWVGKTPWRRVWQPTAVFLPGESHKQRTLAGYSPWGYKESASTEATEHVGTHTHRYRSIFLTQWGSGTLRTKAFFRLTGHPQHLHLSSLPSDILQYAMHFLKLLVLIKKYIYLYKF